MYIIIHKVESRIIIIVIIIVIVLIRKAEMRIARKRSKQSRRTTWYLSVFRRKKADWK